MDGVAAFRQAQHWYEQGAPGHALTTLEPLIEAEPDARSVLELAGRCYYRTAAYGRAERMFSRIVELNPADDYAWYGLGKSVLAQGRSAEAWGHLKVAVSMSPRPAYIEAAERAAERTAATDADASAG